MAKHTDRPTHLVITAATAAELPVDWLQSLEVPVYRREALAAGAWKGDCSAGRRVGVVVVITGVGPQKSAEAARQIQQRIDPLYVVNLGTAGARASQYRPGDWIQPRQLRHGDAMTPGDDRLPFRWPDGLRRQYAGTLRTVDEPAFDPAQCTGDLVDMEAAAQAAVFAAGDTSFVTVKRISDRIGADSADQYRTALPATREELKRVLGFVAGDTAPAVSVIIPVHNRGEWVCRAIDSVLEQRTGVGEIIVVDDASDDDTPQRLNNYGDRIRVLRQPATGGPGPARNAGAAAAGGEWLAFLDSDDRWTRAKLKAQLAYLQRFPFYEMVQSREQWLRNGQRVNARQHHAMPLGWAWHKSLERCLISPSGVLLRKRLFNAAGGFDPRLLVCEDYDLWLRLTRWYPVGLVARDDVIKVGGHADQLSRRFPAMDRFRVYALGKALQGERRPEYRAALLAALETRLAILEQGSRKRDQAEAADRYAALMAQARAASLDWTQWQWCTEC